MISEEQAPAQGVRSVTRAVEILALFDTVHPSRTLRDLVAATGLPKTTVVRLLGTLEGRGLVTSHGETTYALGSAFLRWVRLANSVWEVSAETRAVMHRLVIECEETVNVYIRQDSRRVSIAQEEGTATVRSVVEVGTPMPLTNGATAKVLLGGLEAEHLTELLGDTEATDVATLQRQVAAVVETGYAVSHGERELGASAVAAPIHNADGRVIAALSISGPTSRFTADRVVGYVEAVTRAAHKVDRVGLGNVEALL